MAAFLVEALQDVCHQMAESEAWLCKVTQRAANALHAPFLQPEPSPYNKMRGEVSKVDTKVQGAIAGILA